MKYYIGFFIAFVLIFLITKLQSKYNILQEPYVKNLKISQSTIYNASLFLNKISNKKIKNNKKTQSKLHDSRTNIKVIIMDNQAYWIKDNVFYTANMIGDNVDKDTTRTVDTMAMNRVQLDKMMFIIDRLREEALDDSGSSGY